MGKESEIWDDSALLKAFDNAISKYKKMHGNTYGGRPIKEKEEKEEEQVIDGTDENGQTITDEAESFFLLQRNVELSDSINDVSNRVEEFPSCHNAGTAGEHPSIQKIHLGEESSAPVPYNNSSSCPLVQETYEDHAEYLQGAEYSQLVGQYYALEEQRQNILHQLHQASYGSYQSFTEGSGSCVPWNACCAASFPKNDASYPGHASSCAACTCHCFAAPCPSIPTCAMGGHCFMENDTQAISTACKAIHMGQSSGAEDTIMKAARETAKTAISSMGLNTPTTSNICDEKPESSRTLDGGLSQNPGSEMDLSVVLNAWFSAGFYTAKYLSEQSVAKSRR